MFGVGRRRLTLLVVTASLVAPVAAGGFLLPAASAARVQNRCQIVKDPTREHHTDCPRADLPGADLRGADLRFADLRVADLRGADLSGANLDQARLFGANLSHANLSGAYLTGAIFCHTTMPDGHENNSGCP